jgi:hypothetical protein
MNSKMAQHLAALADAGRALAKVKEIYDDAEEQARAAKRAGLPKEVQNLLTEVALRAARRGGELLLATPLGRGGRPPTGNSTRPPKSLRSIGLGKMQASRWRRLADVSPETFAAHLAECKRLGKAPSARKLLALAEKQSRSRAKRPDTPPVLGTAPRAAQSAGATPPAQVDEELAGLQEHLEHLGDQIKSLSQHAEKAPMGVKRRASGVLAEIRKIVARLRGNWRS